MSKDQGQPVACACGLTGPLPLNESASRDAVATRASGVSASS